MPKTEIDYSNTIIYKIICKDESCKEIYVGHTTNFVQRKHSHKQSCTNNKCVNYNSKLYKVIRENGGWDNWQMEIVQFLNCENSYEARKKEQEYCELLHATLNSIQPLPAPVAKEPVEKKVHKVSNNKDNIILVDSKTEKSDSKNEKATNSFFCKTCDFITTRKSHYDKHILTPKHKQKVKDNEKISAAAAAAAVKNGIYKCICGKSYMHLSGLCKHKKKCDETVEPVQQEETIDNFDFKNMFIEMMKQNEEFKKIMIEQNTKMLELTNTQTITNNNNTINNNNTMNNKFNLNFFLNETCKDAMNIQEFIDYVKVQHSDFENFGKYGYVESMTRIIMRNLMELEVHRRPIHCTDIKREVLYVKDNDVWINDFSREKFIRAIKYIAAKNVKQIPSWMDHNPDSKNTQTKLHDKYMRMVCYSMGGRDEAEDQEYYKKIIHNVAKEVVIDKKIHS